MTDENENENTETPGAARHILAPRSPQVPLVAGESRREADGPASSPAIQRTFAPEKVSDQLVASLTRAEVAAIQHGKRQAQARGGGVGFLTDATFYAMPDPQPADKPVLETDKPPQPPRMFAGDVVMPEGIGAVGTMAILRFKQWWVHDVNTNSPGTMQQPTLEIFQAWRAEDVKTGEAERRNSTTKLIVFDQQTTTLDTIRDAGYRQQENVSREPIQPKERTSRFAGMSRPGD